MDAWMFYGWIALLCLVFVVLVSVIVFSRKIIHLMEEDAARDELLAQRRRRELAADAGWQQMQADIERETRTFNQQWAADEQHDIRSG